MFTPNTEARQILKTCQKQPGASYIVEEICSRLSEAKPAKPMANSAAIRVNPKRDRIMNEPHITDKLEADRCTVTDAFGLEDRDANEVREVASYIHSLEQENAALRQRIALLRGIPQLA